MKRTNRDLNHILDEATAKIRRESVDSSIVNGAAERVWAQLSNQSASAEVSVPPVEQIRGCADFQTLIPAYLHGYLSGSRALLLEDHVHECIPCRKALKAARSGNAASTTVQRPVAKTTSSRPAVKWAIAAALIIGFGLVVIPLVQRFSNSVGTVYAIVQAANGSVYRVADAKSNALGVGARVEKGEKIRTAKEAGAVVRLSDGSTIEMKDRSEFAVTENAQGITIHLDRGNIIVQAAKQHARHLYVATDDCLVSVTGTIFSVNSGTKGSRVSVIEGEVHVSQGGEEQVLHPGDQVSTRQSLDRVPVRDEIAWSRNADLYAKLLALRKDIDDRVSRPGVRYSSRLLEMVPEGTVLYVAIPNLSATLSEANQLLQERIQQNAALREWWEKKQAAEKSQPALGPIIDQIREFGEYLGSEVVVSAGMNQQGEPDEPLVLAELNNPAGFRAYLERKLETLGAESKNGLSVRIIDDPLAAASAREGKSREEISVWIHDNLLAASPKPQSLARLAGALNAQNTNRFAGTAFYSRLAELYREGAGLIVAADLERIISQPMRASATSADDAEKMAAAQQLGLLNLKHFILEMKESQGKPVNRAVLTFDGPRRGISSWLAAPGPMGALEFISPDANVVAAFVVNQPVALVDDLLGSMKTLDSNLWQHLKDLEAEHGVDLRNDIAAPLGGEFAFAVDGPLLPTPSWKLVFEVYDQTHLQQTFERVVDRLNEWAAKEGKAGLRWERAEIGGRTFYTLKSVDFGAEVNYTYAHGYLVAAPSRALVDNAIRYRESGYTLLRSPRFTAALPEDGNTNFSALFYQNLTTVLGPLAQRLGSAGKKSGDDNHSLGSLAAAVPTLAYVYAQGDRIILSANSEGGPFGLSPGGLLGLPGSSGLQRIIQGAMH